MRFFFLALVLHGCANVGRDIQDCITTQLRAVSRSSIPDEKLYEQIAETCKQIYTGRP